MRHVNARLSTSSTKIIEKEMINRLADTSSEETSEASWDCLPRKQNKLEVECKGGTRRSFL